MYKNLGGKIPLMLKITEVAELYSLPVHFVRVLVNSGEIVATRVGNKILVNADRFGDYLNSNTIKNNKTAIGSMTSVSPKITEVKPRINPITRKK